MSSALETVKGAAGLERKPKTIDEHINSLVPEFAKLLGNRMDPIRFARIAYSQVKLNKKLAEDVPGLLTCIAIAATLRLEPGVLGQCYFVPYGGKGGTRCQFITGWPGHVDLVSRANKATVRTLAIREGDEFDYSDGSKPFIHHKPLLDGDEDRPLTATASVGHILGLGDFPQFQVWGFDKLVKHLNRYNKVGERHYALSSGKKLEVSHNFEMYARKIPLLQVVKYLPKSVEWQTAATLDHQADTGKQLLNLQTAVAVIEGDTLEGDPDELTDGSETAIAPKITECFNLLGWTPDVQGNWLAANQKLSDADKIAKLEKELQD